MHRKIVFRSLRSRLGLYIPMIIAVVVTLCLIGAAVIVGDSFHSIVDRQMAKYGANVILKNPSKDDMSKGVSVEVQASKLHGEPVQLAVASTELLLKQNPAWLVRGDGNFLVGQEVASRMSVKQGEQITLSGKSGTAAILKSGTQFDQYVFTEGIAKNPTLELIRSDNPDTYRGRNAVILSEMVKSKYTVLESVGRLMLVMAIISAIASIATVVNLARVDAGRRQKEFGIFKSLGASGGRITKLISSEYLVLAGIAIVTGIAGSAALSWGIIHFVADSTPQWNLWSTLDIALITILAFGSAGLTYILESKRHQVAEELRGV